MKLLADEGCDAASVRALRADGHDVVYVAESMRGAADQEVLAFAFSEARVLITEDKDFGELVHRLQLPACGIVLIRIDPIDRAVKTQQLRNAINKLDESLLESFVVVQKDKVRIRPLR